VAVGFWRVDVFPFPKFQFQNVGLPVDKSWKLTSRGEHPPERTDVKLATGFCAEAGAIHANKTAYSAINLVRILYKLAFKV